MSKRINWRRWVDAVIDPKVSPELEAILEQQRSHLPVLWLLGMTGAGKTSIIQRLTGDSRARIGNGFEPCTRTAMLYEHPHDLPLMRFLDTRGLGEVGYDASDDLAESQQGSHAVLILTRVDEPNQQPLLSALEQLPRKHPLAAIHVHTALHAVSADELDRARDYQRQQVQNALGGRDIPEVSIDFTSVDDGFDNPDLGLPELIDAIVDCVPELTQALAREVKSSGEQEAFQQHRTEVLAYAGMAGATDAIPAVGLLSVPVLQGKMLHALAGRYGMAWDRRLASEFLAVLGGSFIYRYSLSLLGRQLGKLIPVVGQTAGAAAAAGTSFASTWALGRTACYYLFRRRNSEQVSSEELQQLFRDAFREQRNA